MGSGNAQARRPFPQFSNVTWINPSIGNSTYHGGFVRAEKRFGGSFSFLAHYTFSKFIDDVESANEYGITGSYMDAYNRRLDKGLSGSDVPHHLVLTLLYELPKLHGNRRSEGHAGRLEAGRAGDRRIRRAVHRDYHRQYHQRVPGRLAAAEPAARRCAAFRSAHASAAGSIRRRSLTPAPFTFGNSPRSGLRGAPLVTTDVTLEKSFSITEGWKFDLRGEFYNLLNHANLQRPRLHLRRRGFRRGHQRSRSRAPRSSQPV